MTGENSLGVDCGAASLPNIFAVWTLSFGLRRIDLLLTDMADPMLPCIPMLMSRYKGVSRRSFDSSITVRSLCYGSFTPSIWEERLKQR